ncbi:MAG: response regulator transcription factor [Kiritimatiellae bacterium]|nr:response regulator transcription factor [Kiritimatiellia bacterium]MDW8457967.1 response regulator transcription factor [Verrucomicrobiota bacterium]
MTKTTKKRLLVVDDHAIVRQGLAMLLARHPEYAIAAEAAGCAEALAKFEPGKIDAAIIDLALKDGSGLDLIRELLRKKPDLPCIVLSMHDEMEYAERALRAGARGYVMKENADEVLVDALRKVFSGDIYASPDVAARLLKQAVAGPGQARPESGIESLTDREREIFRCVGEGMTTRKIAEKFGLSARTVEVHRASIKRKLGCADTAQLVREAVRWVENNPP